MPKRIQQKRTKGWRKPEGAVSVARPSKWGNPYVVMQFGGEWGVGCHYGGGIVWAGAEQTRECAHLKVVSTYRGLIADDTTLDPAELRGKDLMCWCPLDLPCHADVLLELANGKEVDVGEDTDNQT